jgi:hypothetical protein
MVTSLRAGGAISTISGGTKKTLISTRPNQTVRDVYYSIGTDQTKNLKERIVELHGVDSAPVKAVHELDHYVSDPETRKGAWYWCFYKRVKSAMWALYPHAGDIVRTRMAREFIDDLLNGGYIRALQSLAVPSGANHVDFASDYAGKYGVSIGAALLFGPRGGAIMELLHFLAVERVHGMHRHGTSANPNWSEETRKIWYDAQRTSSWPRMVNEEGEEVLLDIAEEEGCLPQGVAEALREMWRRNPVLRDYTGTNRLSGDTPFQIIEDVVDVLVQKKFSPLDEVEKARYSQVVEQANRQGIDPFYAVYRNLFARRDRLRSLWNKARKWLYDYSLLLWESQNELWLVEGKRLPASGVVYKPRKTAVSKSKKNGTPGTIYLNNGRYYWVVANKMNPRPLIDPKSKPKVPGTIFKDGSRYYWIIPGLLKRQRLIPEHEKFSAKNRTAAERIAYRIWNQLKRDDPKLAETILKRTRSQGLATKDRAVAEKVAARIWRFIKKNDPELAVKILTNNRQKARDHWHAQIVVNGRHRFVGNFDTRAQAEAAYAREFEKVHGYPAGYNVQCIPKIDKVWPTWEEEKARLDQMDEHPRMPVIGQTSASESLSPLITRMQRIDWLRQHIILVFDDHCPTAPADIAIQSRGHRWYEKIRADNGRPVVMGSASIDKDTDRVRITIYRLGLDNRQVLAEELYHIGCKVIQRKRPGVFKAMFRWHQQQLQNGGDPTFSMPDMFAHNMALEESGATTSLPRSVVKSAQRLLSPSNRISPSIMEQVKANWAVAQPV